MRLVFATATVMVANDDVGPVLVREGSHWPADDPIVLANPGLFTNDPKTGLSYSVEPGPERPTPARMEQATRAPGERRG